MRPNKLILLSCSVLGTVNRALPQWPISIWIRCNPGLERDVLVLRRLIGEAFQSFVCLTFCGICVWSRICKCCGLLGAQRSPTTRSKGCVVVSSSPVHEHLTRLHNCVQHACSIGCVCFCVSGRCTQDQIHNIIFPGYRGGSDIWGSICIIAKEHWGVPISLANAIRPISGTRFVRFMISVSNKRRFIQTTYILQLTWVCKISSSYTHGTT